MHKYAIQITVADVRDGACSSSTLLEAGSWGKVSHQLQQMVYAEGTTVIPLIASYVYHNGPWQEREYKNWQKLYQKLDEIKSTSLQDYKTTRGALLLKWRSFF